MDVEQLRSVVDAVAADNRKQKLASLLERLANAYAQTYQSPNAETAKGFEDLRQELRASVEASQCARLPPSGLAILKRLGAGDLCGFPLLVRVESIVASTDTPAAKVSQLQQLKQGLDTFAQTAVTMRDAMAQLKMEASPIPEDAAEVEILIPSSLIDGTLGGLAKESKQLNHALLPRWTPKTGH